MSYLFFVESSGVLMPIPSHLAGKVRVVPDIMPRDVFGSVRCLFDRVMGPRDLCDSPEVAQGARHLVPYYGILNPQRNQLGIRLTVKDGS